MSAEDDYLDLAEEQALDELFRRHTDEFKKDLAYYALLETKESVKVVRGVLAEAEKVLPTSPTGAFLFAASACEITLRDLLFVPILTGLIHEQFAVGVVVQAVMRSSRDQIDRPLTTLLRLLTFINLDETKRRPDSKPILAEARELAKKRNAIIHRG